MEKLFTKNHIPRTRNDDATIWGNNSADKFDWLPTRTINGLSIWNGINRNKVMAKAMKKAAATVLKLILSLISAR